MISQTKLKSRLKRKTNFSLVDTVNEARKHDSWNELAKILSSSTRNFSALNLFQIDEQTKTGDTVVIPGKILSKGDLTKKVRICALSFSQKALEKMAKTKSEAVSILEEIQKNKKAEGVRILR